MIRAYYAWYLLTTTLLRPSLEGQLGLILSNEVDENHAQNGNYLSHFAQLMYRHMHPPQGASSVTIFSAANNFVARAILKIVGVNESLFHFNVDHRRLSRTPPARTILQRIAMT